jgi:hypothetical protein
MPDNFILPLILLYLQTTKRRGINSCFTFTKIIFILLYHTGGETHTYDQQPTAQNVWNSRFTRA